MSDFKGDIGRFVTKLTGTQLKVFRGTAEQMLYGIKEGSASSGAPGQPVDTGYLKGSWQIVWESDTTALIGTNVSYAPVIEEDNRAAYDERGTKRPDMGPVVNVGRAPTKSTVGGHHSVKLTRLNFDRIVRNVVNEVVG